MKLNLYIIFALLVLFIFTFFGLNKLEDTILTGTNDNLVQVKYFTNSKCKECTNIDDYLKVYKKAGVQFGNISIKEYGSIEYKKNFNNYNIKKLPFIVFSKELNSYKTISDSWNNTFGYKNNRGEYIANDIIPPYFDVKAKKIFGLIDVIFIGDKSCINCFNLNDSINILKSFGLRFNKKTKIDISEKDYEILTEKYKIKKIPTIILSKDVKLYKNFKYFWKTIGTIENDGNYILRYPEKIGLKIKK